MGVEPVTEATLSAADPWARRFLAWVGERFNLAQMLPFATVLYAAALLSGRAASGSGELAVGTGDLRGLAAFFCFLLMLRVFDEHKDYEIDCLNHPGRVLQRGLVTLDQLKVVGGVAIAVQLVMSLWIDGGPGPVTATWGVVIAWSLLMAREFFCGAWLSRRLVLYAVSHMVVLPMAMVWASAMGAGRVALTGEVVIVAAFAFCTGFVAEVTRKIRAPGDERETVDSYSKVFGTTRAPLVVVGLLAAGTGLLAAAEVVLAQGAGRVLGCAAAGALFAVAALPYLAFSRSPSASGAKKMEAGGGVFLLGGYTTVIVTFALTRGLQWT